MFGSTDQISRSARATGMRAARIAGSRPPTAPITAEKIRPPASSAGVMRNLNASFAEAGHVRRAGRQPVDRQRQDAADRRRRPAPARSIRRETPSRCAAARSRARAACRFRACDRRPPRTSCSSRRTSRRSTGSAVTNVPNTRITCRSSPRLLRRSSPARAAAADRGADRRRSPPRTTRTPTDRPASTVTD